LPHVDGRPFVQAKPHQAALGASPSAIKRARNLQILERARRRTQTRAAIDATGGPHAIQAKPGKKMRGWMETYEERIRNPALRTQPSGSHVRSGVDRPPM
jgi:hypothetical protein